MFYNNNSIQNSRYKSQDNKIKRKMDKLYQNDANKKKRIKIKRTLIKL